MTEEEKELVKSVADGYGLTMARLIVMLVKYANENKPIFVVPSSRRKKNTRLQRESQPSIEPTIA